MPEQPTSFITRSAGLAQRHKGKALATGGTGLSAAAVIWIYSMFATKPELARVEARSLNDNAELVVSIGELEQQLDSAKQMIARLDERTKKQ